MDEEKTPETLTPEETLVLREAENAVSDEQGFKSDVAKTRQLIDAGEVMLLMAVEGKGVTPVPVTAVFQQLFGLLNHIDQRLINLEEKLKVSLEGESRILTLN